MPRSAPRCNNKKRTNRRKTGRCSTSGRADLAWAIITHSPDSAVALVDDLVDEAQLAQCGIKTRRAGVRYRANTPSRS